jgi:hypothetical protein
MNIKRLILAAGVAAAVIAFAVTAPPVRLAKAVSPYYVNLIFMAGTCTDTAFNINAAGSFSAPSSPVEVQRIEAVNGGTTNDNTTSYPLGGLIGTWSEFHTSQPYIATQPYTATYTIIFSANGVMFSKYGMTVTNVQPGEPGATDGRINWDSSKAGPVAMYCDEDTLKVYDVSKGDGVLALTFSDWPEGKPAVNTLLKSGGGVSLWHLTTGEYQINADGGEGKTYAFVFNGCPYDGKGYNVNLDPGS